MGGGFASVWRVTAARLLNFLLLHTIILHYYTAILLSQLNTNYITTFITILPYYYEA